MSIALAQPSLLLNSYAFTDDVFGGCGMFMDTTWNCPKTTRCQDIVTYILWAYNKTKRLHHVVFNFHGPGEDAKPGEHDKVQLGEATPESGFGTNHYTPPSYFYLDLSNVSLFSALKGKNIGTIWFHSCALAMHMKGKYLCQRMAEVSGCSVVAAEEDQSEWLGFVNLIFMPRGSIDDYEGPVNVWSGKDGIGRRFSPNGRYWT